MNHDGLIAACAFDADSASRLGASIVPGGRRILESPAGRILLDPGAGRVARMLSVGTVDACLVVPEHDMQRIESLDLAPFARAFEEGRQVELETLGLERYLGLFVDSERKRGLVAGDRVNLLAQLYCLHRKEGLLLSELLGPLLAAASEAQRKIRLQSLYDYLYFHFIPSPHTLYEGIQALVPEHWLVFDVLEMRQERCNPLRYAPETAGQEPALRKRRLLELIDASVGNCLAHLPESTGTFLSGGLDSSTVTGLASRHRPGIRAYSIGFAQEGYDEIEYARLASERFGVEHHVYYVTPRDIAELVPRLAGSLDQPYGNSSIVPAYHCARMACEQGDTALLAGDGGDELFGGNFRYAKQLLFERYYRIPRFLRQWGFDPLCSALDGRRLPAPFRKVVNYVNQARIPLPDRLETYNFIDRMGAEAIFTREFLSCIDRESPIGQLRAFYAAAVAEDPLNRMLDLDMKFTIRDNDLFKVDTACRMVGVAVEYPMLGREVIDFSLTLHQQEKVKGMRLRHLFKESVQGFLPDEIIQKKKHGFGLPFGHWAVQDRELAKLVRESLDAFSQRGVIRAEFIDSLLGRHLPEYPGYYGTFVWVILMLEQWLSSHQASF